MADFEIYRKKRNAYLNIALEKGRLKDTYQDEETRADPKHGRKIVKKIREEDRRKEIDRATDAIMGIIFQ